MKGFSLIQLAPAQGSKGPRPKRPAATWFLQVAPQHIDLVTSDLKIQGFEAAPRAAALGAGCLKFQDTAGIGDTLAPEALPPALAHPYIQRIWRQDHLWPGALKDPQFFDKCAEGLWVRWQRAHPGQRLDPAKIGVSTTFRDRSHLRGRLLQSLVCKVTTAQSDAKQTHDRPCESGLEVLLTPKAAIGSFLPHQATLHSLGLGKINPAETTPLPLASRAGLKALQALDFAWTKNFWPAPPFQKPSDKPLLGQHWLDLGASPGGVSSVLLRLGAQVTAIDRAQLAPDIAADPSLVFICADATLVDPALVRRTSKVSTFDGLFCDINGSPEAARRAVAQLVSLLGEGQLLIFTLKLREPSLWKTELSLCEEFFCGLDLEILAARHLEANRDELTIFARRCAERHQG